MFITPLIRVIVVGGLFLWSAPPAAVSANESPSPLPSNPVPQQLLDQYGGFAAIRSKKGATGYFRLEKFGKRWMLVTPDGNAFWMRSVFNGSAGNVPETIINVKYRGNRQFWAQARNVRLLNWGFNTLGEYVSSSGLPVGVYGSREGVTPRLPFILMLTPGADAFSHPPEYMGLNEAIKDVVAGVPGSAYDGWRGAPLVDVYDPGFAAAAAWQVKYWNEVITGGFGNKSWIVGVTIEDADCLYGFKSRGGKTPAPYPHIGYLVATAKFSYSAAENTNGHRPFHDPRLYAKYAWVAFLKERYRNDIARLNESWRTGGFYTSFDDAGGYGTGAGVIDEDGRHRWMGTMGKDDYPDNAYPGVLADLDGFAYNYARDYTRTVISAIRKVDAHHLIFGPASINNYGAKARDPILKGLADGGIDAFQFNYDPSVGPLAGSMSENNRSYDLTGKPAYMWYSVASNRDSPLRSAKGSENAPQFPTQAGRGAHARDVDLPAFLNARGANGDYYVIGYDWWSMFDSPWEGGGTNWGLITAMDNAYDSRESVRAAVSCSPPMEAFVCGGEAHNYSDFISYIRRANAEAAEKLAKELAEQSRKEY